MNTRRNTTSTQGSKTTSEAPKATTKKPFDQSADPSSSASRRKSHKTRIEDLEEDVSGLREAVSAIREFHEQLRKQDPVLAKREAAKVREIIELHNNGSFAKLPELFEKLDRKYQSAIDALNYKFKVLDGRVAENYQLHVELQVRVDKLEALGIDKQTLQRASQAGAVSDQRSFVRYMTSHGVSAQQLREFFNLVSLDGDDAPLDLTNDEIFHEFMTEIMAQLPEINSRLTASENRLDDHDEKLKDHDEKFNDHVTETHERFESIEKITQDVESKVPLVIGLVAFALSWFFVVPISSHSGAWEFGAMVAIGFAAICISSFFVGRINQTKAVTSANNRYYEARNKRAQSDSIQSEAKDAEGSDNPQGTPPEGAPEPSDASKTPEPATRQLLTERYEYGYQ